MGSVDHRESGERFAQVFTDAVARSGMTLQELRGALRERDVPVSIATLSYWRSGRSIPARERSLKALEELERVLHVGAGQLTGALPSDALQRWDVVKAAGVDEQGKALLDAMGLTLRGQLHNEFLHDVVVSAVDGTQVETTTQLLRAAVDGLDRVPMAFRMNFLEDPPPLITAVAGCELGRVVQLDDEGLQVGELLLPRPLAVGERCLLEYRLDWEYPQDLPEGGFSRVLPEPVEHYALEVRLPSRPLRANYRSLPNDYQGVHSPDALERPLDPSTHMVHVFADAPAGLHEVQWQARELREGEVLPW
ncbi:hypothetical protein [Luteococcus japonicus]|uniref:Uncharacterized protein n=1 Tax=Luteococcus japonicus LSP_Lj1 TaxID=1255658 RepID=A0A1R4JF97_9ACTN|nr:hypothetical protein [Luteococcus japonicus]SJN30780.1 hypothetical protein FM114_07220 [Luteococcus japonicus LSP_Lj1]